MVDEFDVCLLKIHTNFLLLAKFLTDVDTSRFLVNCQVMPSL